MLPVENPISAEFQRIQSEAKKLEIMLNPGIKPITIDSPVARRFGERVYHVRAFRPNDPANDSAPENAGLFENLAFKAWKFSQAPAQDYQTFVENLVQNAKMAGENLLARARVWAVTNPSGIPKIQQLWNEFTLPGIVAQWPGVEAHWKNQIAAYKGIEIPEKNNEVCKAAEIRAFVRGLDNESTRSEFIRKAAARNDIFTVSAIFDAPLFLSGIDQTTPLVEQTFEQFIAGRNPAAVAKRDHESALYNAANEAVKAALYHITTSCGIYNYSTSGNDRAVVYLGEEITVENILASVDSYRTNRLESDKSLIQLGAVA